MDKDQTKIAADLLKVLECHQVRAFQVTGVMPNGDVIFLGSVNAEDHVESWKLLHAATRGTAELTAQYMASNGVRVGYHIEHINDEEGEKTPN